MNSFKYNFLGYIADVLKFVTNIYFSDILKQ